MESHSQPSPASDPLRAEASSEPNPSALRRISGLIALVVVLGLWAVLAWRTPTSTFHFAPIIAAGSLPVVQRMNTTRLPLGLAARQSALGVGSTLLVGVALHISNRLEGPTFWTEGGAIYEVLGFAAVGGVFGLWYASRAEASSQG